MGTVLAQRRKNEGLILHQIGATPPETLLLELLGSRKNILFCEGSKGSIDEKIYSILFPHLTITPVGSCFEVINHTKAFNKLSNVTTKAIGLIDSDHHDAKRLNMLRNENVFCLKVVEPENLLLDENFLLKLANNVMLGANEVNSIKENIISDLVKEKEQQISNYIAAKVDYYFKDSNVKKGNNLQAVKENYELFTKEIKLDEWHASRSKELNEIIDNKDYIKTISVFNHKGFKKNVNKNFNISDFTERAIRLLQIDPTTHEFLKQYFPDELKL